MRVVVVFNPRSGVRCSFDRSVAEQRDELIALFAEAGVTATAFPLDTTNVGDAVRRAIADRADAVVAAGGDGTVSAVAGVLAGTDMPMGVLPWGTLNHFAKDVGIPLDARQAVRAIATGHSRAVDVVEVNGRRFVNNSSIGLYPHLVSTRDRQRERFGYGRWKAMLAALVAVFRRYPVVSVVLETPEERVPRTTPFVFVGNNRYAVHGLMIGTRRCLDEGVLSLYFANRTGRLGLLRLALRALFGRLEQAKDFDSMAVTSVRIHTRKQTLKVAVDGEVVRLVPPLVYRIRPGALRVIVGS